VKAPVEFVLPLLGQITGADHETTLQVAAGDQFLHQEPSHDGLAGTGIVSEQEA